MPLTDRTTVTPDLEGCLEEVSRIVAGAGTRPQRHDLQNEPVRVTATGNGPLDDNTKPEPHTNDPEITGTTLPKKGRYEKSTLG